MMIGVDTNILVRHITQDDETQAAIVSRIFNHYKGKTRSIFISNIVLCELIWVLEGRYKYKKDEIIKTMHRILATIEFAFEEHSVLWCALLDYGKFDADFSDILIGKLNRQVSCSYTITFDKKAALLNDFLNPKNMTL